MSYIQPKAPRAISYPKLIAPILILALGFLLRIYRLDSQAFTGDEAFSIVNWTHATITDLFDTIAGIDPQPPLALLSLSQWARLTGESEFASRTLSVLASTITLATIYTITHRLANRKTALLATLLCAINPFQIWYAQDFRPYSLWVALSTLSLHAFLSALSHPPSRTKWIAYTLLATAAIYTFYLEVFFLLAQNIIIAYHSYTQRRLRKPWLLTQLAIAAALTPWLLRPAILTNHYQPTAGMPNIPQALSALLFGETIPTFIDRLLALYTPIHALIPITLASFSLLILYTQRTPKTALVLSTYIFVPIISLSALALLTHRGYYRPRYIAPTSLSLTITIALFLNSMFTCHHPPRLSTLLIATFTATVTLIVSTISLLHYYYDPAFAKAPNWPALTNTLRLQTATTDIVIFNYPDPAFIHYFTGPAHKLYLPRTANPPQQQVDQQIASLITTYDYLWFVPVYADSWDSQQVIAKALTSQAQLISEQWIGTTHLFQYTSWTVSPTQIAIPLTIQLGDLATIEGYRTTPHQDEWHAGSTIFIELFWKPLRRTPQQLTVFSHLLGPIQPNGSPLWAQDDYPPQDGHTSTCSWTIGSLIRDTYTLKLPNRPVPTTYTITIGLYDPQTNERYLLDHNTPQAEPNGATLLTFTIQPTN